jgi:septal ring factor EnvC (AmiA/AmiB activator)
MDTTTTFPEMQEKLDALTAQVGELMAHIAKQAAEMAKQAAEMAKQAAEMAKQAELIKYYEGQFMLMKRRQFGPSSEKTEPDIRQITLFGDTAEAVVPK